MAAFVAVNPVRARVQRDRAREAPNPRATARAAAAGHRMAVVAALLAVAPAAASEPIAVLAVADPPAGPDQQLAALALGVRAACSDRVDGVADAPTVRARLLGQPSGATLAELDRTYAGALGSYRRGDFEVAIRTLEGIVSELERLPESEAGHAQWIRAQLRLAQAALTIGRDADADAAMLALVRVDPEIQPDPDQYSPSYRRRLEGAKEKARALPVRRLQVRAEGGDGVVFVNGRAVGRTPLTLSLPAGAYRVGGASGALRVPSVPVDLSSEDRVAVLDFRLADAIRPHGGPGLALPPERRDEALARAGAWLEVQRIVAVSREAAGDAQRLVATILDVRGGSVLREGSVRMVGGSVPAARLGALAAFLLSGEPSPDVEDRTATARERASRMAGHPQEAAPRERGKPSLAAAPPRAPLLLGGAGEGRSSAGRALWMRRGAYGSAALVGVFTGLAIQQGLAAREAGTRADRMLSPDGYLAPGSDPSRYQDLRSDARSASRNAYVSGGVAIVFAATAGLLGWSSREPAPRPELALRF